MTQWNLHEYRDSRDPVAMPELVGVFEDGEGDRDENHALLDAIEQLKEERSGCLPVVTRADTDLRRVEVLHVVKRCGAYDALFQTFDIARQWIDRRCYRARQRPPISQTDRETYEVESIRVNKFQVHDVVPRSRWEWLRAPAF